MDAKASTSSRSTRECPPLAVLANRRAPPEPDARSGSKRSDTQRSPTFTWRQNVRGYDHKRPTSGGHRSRPDT